MCAVQEAGALRPEDSIPLGMATRIASRSVPRFIATHCMFPKSGRRSAGPSDGGRPTRAGRNRSSEPTDGRGKPGGARTAGARRSPVETACGISILVGKNSRSAAEVWPVAPRRRWGGAPQRQQRPSSRSSAAPGRGHTHHTRWGKRARQFCGGWQWTGSRSAGQTDGKCTGNSEQSTPARDATGQRE